MFCPDCKAEYVEGFTQCSDCQVPLVWTLPEESKNAEQEGERISWIPLLTSTYEADIALIKSILDSENITYWIDGEHRGLIRGGNMGSTLYVDESHQEDAENLVRELNLNVFGWSTRSNNETE
jgi:hypothetical protein